MQPYDLTQADVDLIFESLAGIATIQIWQLTMMLIGLGLMVVLVLLLASQKYR